MSGKKAALGRGLNSLLPDAAEPAPKTESGAPSFYQFDDRVRMTGRLADIDIDRIDPNPFQPRESFDKDTLAELAQSIAELGIVQPLTVRAGTAGRFELIAGERRLRAARIAGKSTVPAYVRVADDEAMLEMAIVENVQRDELDPIETALAFRRLMDECELTHEDVARKVGRSRAAITNALRLLRLEPAAQASLRRREISAGHGRALLGLENPEDQLRLLAEIVSNDLSVRQVESSIKKLQRSPTISRPKAAAAMRPSTEDLLVGSFEDRLRRSLGTQVRVRRGSKGHGRIEVEYYSDDDLVRLVDMLSMGRPGD